MATAKVTSAIDLDPLSIPELTALIETATAKRAEKQEEAKRTFLADMRAKAEEIGISFDSLLPARPAQEPPRKQRADAGTKAPAKYRSPKGEEWTGRGRKPGWLKAMEDQGRAQEEFRI